MAMTGKYAGTEDSVTVSAAIEAALLERLPSNLSHNDAGGDVEFHCCADGVVIDVPVTGGDWSKHAFNFNVRQLGHVGNAWIADLKAIYEGKTPTAERRMTRSRTIHSDNTR